MCITRIQGKRLVKGMVGQLGEISAVYQLNVAHTEITSRMFQRVYRRGQLGRLVAVLKGRSSELPLCTDLLLAATPGGTCITLPQPVPIAQIIGTEGRAYDFDRCFRPLRSHLRARWQSIALLWLTGKPLPPVRLIRLDNTYIVRDGHHRISVACAFGASTVEALIVGRFHSGQAFGGRNGAGSLDKR